MRKCSPGKRRERISVMSRTTAPEGDVTMPMRCGSRGMGRLRAAIEQAFGRQFLLQLFEGELQRAVALRLDGFHQKLILAARFVDVDVAARQHRHAVLRFELEVTQATGGSRRSATARHDP